MEGVRRRYGHDLGAWRRERLEAGVAAVAGPRSTAEVLSHVLREPVAFQGLLGAVLGAPPAAFGDAAGEAALRELVLPVLRTWPFLRIWYVGRGDGADVERLRAILAAEGLAARTRLFATDVSEADVVGPDLVFGRHVPFTDGGLGEFGLVVCRHLLHVVGLEHHDALCRALHESVVRFGVLWLGPGQSLRRTPLADAYETLDVRLGLHRRIR